MEVKWLEDFLTVASTGSFSKAAEQRNVTQPAFSRRIKSLELWLGTDLIDRSTYPTKLTRNGLAFRETAEEAVAMLQGARQSFREHGKTERATLSFASLHALAVNYYPKWISGLQQDGYDMPATRVTARDLHDCVHALKEGESDFLLTHSHVSAPILVDPEEYPSLLLDEEQLLLVSAPDDQGHPLFTLPEGERDKVPFLRYSSNGLLGRVQDYMLKRLGIARNLKVVYENSMAEALKTMALERQGLCWMPERCIERELSNGRLVIVDPNLPVETLNVRLFRATNRSRPAVERFWQFLQARAELD